MNTTGRLLLLLLTTLLVVACGRTPGAGQESNPPSASVPSFPPVGDGEPTNVQPVPGTQQTRDVPAQQLDVALDGRRVYVRLAWWSGVEPCNVLDSVALQQTGSDIQLTIREGTTDPDAICIELAMLKSTVVDLGELEPGTYTISAYGDAAPVTVEVL